MPKVVHFEVPIDDPERAVAFYSKCFGWKIDKWEGGGQDYWLVTAGDEKEPGINGGLARRQEQMPALSMSIGVPSVDELMAKVAGNGGKVLTTKMPVPGVGYVAYFQDTEGNFLSLFQPDAKAK